MKRQVKTPYGVMPYVLIQTTGHRLLLKVLPQGNVWLYAPKSVRLRDADAFVVQHAEDILRMREQIDAQQRDSENNGLHSGDSVRVEGVPHTLIAEKGRKGGRIENGVIRVSLPDPEDTQALRDAVRKLLVEHSLARFTEQLTKHAPALGVRYGRVTIREQKTRWGSCSSKHNLNFNWKLIMAPPQALEYVVIHELCHLIEFNHSPRFWHLVESLMPEYDYWKKWLKEHGKELGV